MDLHEYARKFHESKKATGRAAETQVYLRFDGDQLRSLYDRIFD